MKKDLMHRSLDSIGQTGDRLAKSPPEEPDASIAHVRGEARVKGEARVRLPQLTKYKAESIEK